MVNLFLYGTLSAPNNLYDRIKTEAYINSLIGNLDATNDPAVEVNVDAGTFLSSGAGRFAFAAEAPIVNSFFTRADFLGPGEYTLVELQTIIGARNSALGNIFGTLGFVDDNTNFGIEHIRRTDNSGDFEEAERAFIFNNAGFTIDASSSADDPVFVIEIDPDTGEEVRFIRNLQVSPLDDNFDFDGGSLGSDAFNFFFQDRIDPFNIGTQVEFDFDNSTGFRTAVYTEQFFQFDRQEIGEQTQSFPTTNNFNQLADVLTANGTLLFEIDGFSIVYGTFADNSFSLASFSSLGVFGPILVLGGEGEDVISATISGSRLYGHEDNDTLRGNLGADLLFGGSNDDTITGSFGNDVIFGDFSEENFNGAEEPNGVAGNDTLSGDIGDDSLFGGEGRDVIDGGIGDDTLYGNNEDNTNDNISDILSGGSGTDFYFVRNSDVINDDPSDRGFVFFDDIRLQGGLRVEGTSDEDAGGAVYRGGAGETYNFEGRDLIVTLANGEQITINSFSQFQHGIELVDPDDPPPPDDPSPSPGGGRPSSPSNFGSPLILDLDGDGIETSSLEQNAVFFDIDNDGIRERTAFVGPDDGLLALDRNGDGQITDANELFGYQDTVSITFSTTPNPLSLEAPGNLGITGESGFDRLRELDDNGDGFIDSNDAAYGDLVVWRDLDQDGRSDEGELILLVEAGVAAISLADEARREFLNGNLLTDISSFITTDGDVRDIGDVFFRFDQQAIDFDRPVDLDPAILDLPNIFGTGAVRDLQTSIASDPVLRQLVEEFTNLTSDQFGEVSGRVEQIILRWHGVDSDIETAFGRSAFASATHVAVLESVRDTPFNQVFDDVFGQSPRPDAGSVLETQYARYHRDVAARLILQTDFGRELFPEIEFFGGDFIDLASDASSAEILARLELNAPEGVLDKLPFWHATLRLLDTVFGSFSDVSETQYINNVEDLLQREGLDFSYAALITAYIGTEGEDGIIVPVGNGGRSFSGRNTATIESVIIGGEGDDEIRTGVGEQIVYYGEGQGNDLITIPNFRQDGPPQTTIRLVDLNFSDVSFERGLTGPLDFTLTIISTGETLTIANAFAQNSGRPAGVFEFADGAIFNFETIFAGAETQGGDGADIIFESPESAGAPINGGEGNDLLIGAEGVSIYVYEIGSGQDIIQDADSGNIVQFGAGITRADLVFTSIGATETGTLVVTFLDRPDETLTIVGQLTDNPTVSRFEFNDGTILLASDVMQFGAFLDGTDGNDVLSVPVGTTGLFRGGVGEDALVGGSGSDRYIFSLGDGNDTLEDRGSVASFNPNEDRIVFADQLIDNVQYSRPDPLTEDLLVTYGNIGDSILIIGGLSARNEIEFIEFADGQVISADDVRRIVLQADIDNLDGVVTGTSQNDIIESIDVSVAIDAGDGDDVIISNSGNDVISGGDGNDDIDTGAGNDEIQAGDGDDVIRSGQGDDLIDAGRGSDAILYASGDGQDLIRAGGGSDNTLIFEDSDVSDLVVSRDGNDVVLTFLGNSIDSLRLEGQLSAASPTFFNFGPSPTIGAFQFADGEVLSFVNIRDLAFRSEATDGDDTIFGTSTTERIFLSNGNDVLNGGRASDIYVREAGVTGATRIEENQFDTADRLILEEFNLNDVSISLDANGRDVVINLPTGSVTLVDQRFESGFRGVDFIEFADGLVLDAINLLAEAISVSGSEGALVGTTANETLTGTGLDETLDGGAGDDLLAGGEGSDLYIFGEGSGNDRIEEDGESGRFSIDRIELSGLNQSDVELTRIDPDDLQITILATGEILTVANHFAGTDSGIEVLLFADGAELNRQEIFENAPFRGTAGNDVFVRTSASEVIELGEGDDVISQSSSNTPDIFIFSAGDGNDVIENFSTGDLGQNIIVLRDVSPDSIILNRTGISVRDLLISYGDGDSILVESQFGAGLIAEIRFDDGTVITSEEILAQARILGTDGNDNISGGFDDEVYDVRAGDDVITGSAGDDTYIWGAGSGSDTIIETSRFIQFIEAVSITDNSIRIDGLSVQDLNFSRDDLDLIITNLTTGETLTVTRQFEEGRFDGSTAFFGVGQIVFDDGTVFGRQEISALAPLTGSLGNDDLRGDDLDDTFLGGEGDDFLTGEEGSDTYIWRLGDGNDTIDDFSFDEEDIDTIVFQGVSPSDISFSRDTFGDLNDLLITINSTGEQIRVLNQLDRFVDVIERLTFDDGTEISLAGLADTLPLQGTDGDDFLSGSFSDDIIIGGLGDDVLEGEEFNDTYVYRLGDGNDVIREAGGSAFDLDQDILPPGNDTLRLEGIGVDDISFSRPEAPTVIDGVLVFEGPQVFSDFVFFDFPVAFNGPVEFQSSAFFSGPASFNSTAVFERDVNFQDFVEFGVAAVFEDDVSFTTEFSFGDADITFLGNAEATTPATFFEGDQVFTEDAVFDGPVNFFGDVEFQGQATFNGPVFFDFSATFRDDVTFNSQVDFFDESLALFEGTRTDNVTVFEGAQTFTDDVTFDGVVIFLDAVEFQGNATFNQFVEFQAEANFLGDAIINDAFSFDGADVTFGGHAIFCAPVEDEGGEGDGGADTGGDPNFFFEPNNDLIINILSTGETITIQDYFLSDAFEVERIVLDDGTEISLSDIASTLLPEGTDNADQLGGTSGDDTLNGSFGDDVLSGGAGDDTYIIGTGTGDDFIFDNAGADRVLFEDDISSSDVAFFRDGNDLIVEIGGFARTAVRIGDQFSLENSVVETFEFADGTIITADQVKAEILSQTSTGANNIIQGFAGDDVITARAGDDIIDLGDNRNDNDFVYGGEGRDTVIFEGRESDYTVDVLEDRILVTHRFGDGTTTLFDVESIQFQEFGSSTEVEVVENIAPVAGELVLDGREDQVLTLRVSDLLAAASDPDGATLTIVDLSAFEGGTAILDGDVIRFTPDADFNGEATFQYTVSDRDGAIASEQVTIVLSAVNDAPVVLAPLEDATVSEDSFVTVALPASAFIDVDGDVLALSASLVDGSELPAWLSFDPDTQTFSGQPPENFNGVLSLLVTASDGVESVTSSFSLIIDPANDAPLLAAPLENFEGEAGEPFVLDAVSNTFSDIDGDTLTFAVGLADGSPLPDWLSFIAEFGIFVGNPPSGVTGDFDIVVTASDGELSVSDAFTITIAAGNDAPVVVNTVSDQSIAEDTFVDFALPGDTFSDVDGDVLALSTSLADGGELPSWLNFDAATGVFSGQPPLNFNGDLELLVTASDGEFSVSTGFTLAITPVNDAPSLLVPLSDQSGLEDNAVAFTLPADAFVDVEGDVLTLTASLASGEALPVWLIFNPNTVTFSGQPPQDFNGPLEITVTASDGELTASDTFLLTIGAVNDAPIVSAGIADQTGTEDTFFSLEVPADAFSDVDGDELALTATLAGGAVLPIWLSFDGQTFSGQPPQDFNGALDIIVTATDGEFEASQLFTVIIDPVNDAPILENALADQAFDEDTSVAFVVPVDTFSDVDGDALTLTASLADGSSLPSWLVFDGTGFSGSPPQDFNGELQLRVTASDGELDVFSDFTLEITPVNDAVIAVDDEVSTDEDTPLTISVLSLLENDFDLENNSFQLTAILGVTGGTAVLDGEGNIIFTPEPNFSGEASFTYEVTDIFGAVSEAVVTVNVAPVNDAPDLVLSLVDQTGPEDEFVSFEVPAGTFVDIDSDAFILTARSADGSPLPEWLSFDGQTFSGTPPQDFNGLLSVIVTASDGELSTDAAFNLEITPVNDAPVSLATLESQFINEDEAFSFTIDRNNFQDVDGDTLVLAARLANGEALPEWLSFDPESAVFSGAPPQDFNGILPILVTASDGELSTFSVFQLVVNNINDAPVLVNEVETLQAVEDQAVFFVLPEDTFLDVDGDSLAITARLENGDELPETLRFEDDTLFGFLPQDFNGLLEITLEATDGEAIATETFSIDVAAVNDAPIANADLGLETFANVDLFIEAETLLANDIDVDGDELTILSVSGGEGGQVSLTEEGDVLYTADEFFSGFDQFNYVVTDGEELAVGIVQLEVQNAFSEFDQGTDGNDVLFGNLFEENNIFGADGDDFIVGGLGADRLFGGNGNDIIFGLFGADELDGGAGNDRLFGGFGDDALRGGSGTDILFGGRGVDEFTFRQGDGIDFIGDFTRARSNFFFTVAGDRISIDIEGVNDFDDLLDFGEQVGRNTVFDFGDGDVLILNSTRLAALDEDVFTFF